MFHEYFAGRPYLRDTYENSNFHDSSHSSHVLNMWLLHELASRKIHLIFNMNLSLHTLSHPYNKNPT